MRSFYRLIFLIAASLLALGSGLAHAEVVVVVDAAAGIERLTPDQVINIFLGRHRKLPSGIAALPVDQPATDNLRAEFYRKLVDKDLNEINAYWARLHFSGKTAPPTQAASATEVLKHVIGKPGGIGYIDRSQADARVRIVLTFPP
jgi:ABC-type phosphate transport system substrate-binding protein